MINSSSINNYSIEKSGQFSLFDVKKRKEVKPGIKNKPRGNPFQLDMNPRDWGVASRNLDYWSHEQKEILEWVANNVGSTSHNLRINAVAGAGKTTILEAIANLEFKHLDIRLIKILALVFNNSTQKRLLKKGRIRAHYGGNKAISTFHKMGWSNLLAYVAVMTGNGSLFTPAKSYSYLVDIKSSIRLRAETDTKTGTAIYDTSIVFEGNAQGRDIYEVHEILASHHQEHPKKKNYDPLITKLTRYINKIIAMVQLTLTSLDKKSVQGLCDYYKIKLEIDDTEPVLKKKVEDVPFNLPKKTI